MFFECKYFFICYFCIMKTLYKFKIVYIIVALLLLGALLFAAYKFGTLNKQKSYDTQMSGMACGED